MGTTPLFQGAVRNIAARIASTDGTGLVTIITGAGNGTIINNMQITSTVATTRTLTLFLTVGGVDYPLAIYTITANAGNSANGNAFGIFGNISNTPAPQTTGITLDLDALGNKVYKLANGASLRASISSATTAGTFINFTGVAADL